MSGAVLNIKISKKELERVESQMRLERHVERYRYIRRFCNGKVLDIGCGCGYGSYLISQNPTVESVVGIEPNQESWKHAFLEFKNPKITYYNQTFGKRTEFKGDVAVILEVLEHVENAHKIIADCAKLGITQIIASVPSYPTTHFNPHHVRDYSESEFIHMMHSNGYKKLNVRNFRDEVYLGQFILNEAW